MKIPQWTDAERQQLAQGLARVEIDYRRVPVRVRVVPMEPEPVQTSGPDEAEPKPRTPRADMTSISAAAYRRRMGWPPV